VKGNRQGSLSRWIKQLFETFLKFQKVHQRVEKIFFDTLNSRPVRLFFCCSEARQRGGAPFSGARSAAGLFTEN